MNTTTTLCYVPEEDLNKWRDIASGHPRRHFSIWEGNSLLCTIDGTTMKNKGGKCCFPSLSREGMSEKMTRFTQWMPPSFISMGVTPRFRKVDKLFTGTVVIRTQHPWCACRQKHLHPDYGELTLRWPSNESQPWTIPSLWVAVETDFLCADRITRMWGDSHSLDYVTWKTFSWCLEEAAAERWVGHRARS